MALKQVNTVNRNHFTHFRFLLTIKVINYLFNWLSPRTKPSQQEIVCLLRKKFTMRVDTQRKVIEHAASQNLDELLNEEYVDEDVMKMICGDGHDDEIDSKKQKTE